MATNYGHNSQQPATMFTNSIDDRWLDHNNGTVSSPLQQPTMERAQTDGTSTLRSSPSAADASFQGSEADARYTDIVGKLSAWYHGVRYTVDELWKAAISNNVPVVQKCLKAGLSVNYCRWSQYESIGFGVRSIADISVIKNYVRMMRLLIEHKVDLTGTFVSMLARHTRLRTQFLQTVKASQVKEDQLWTTPLHEACKHSRLEILQVLLSEGGAHPDTLDSQQATSLFIATRKKDAALARQLLLSGANIELGKLRKINPLASAAFGGNTELVKLLLEHGAIVDTVDYRGETAFYNASMNGHDEIMRMLVAHGADVNVRNATGASPFFFAASGVHIETMNALIKYGADVDFPDNNGCTALFRAVLGRNMKLLTYLIGRGSDIDRVNHLGWTPLYAAMILGEDQLVLFLLTNGCNTSVADRLGNTPMHQAAMLDSVVAIRYMLTTTGVGNTMFSRENVFGETLISLACKYDNSSVVKVLLKHGANVQHRDSNGLTALNRAMYHGSYACVLMLLQFNAEVDHTALQCLQQGRIDFADSRGHDVIFALLQRRYGIASISNATPSVQFQGLLAMATTREELMEQLRGLQKKVTADKEEPGKTQTLPNENGSDDPFSVTDAQTSQMSVLGSATSPGGLGASNALKLGAVAGAVAGEVVVNQIATNLASTLLGV